MRSSAAAPELRLIKFSDGRHLVTPRTAGPDASAGDELGVKAEAVKVAGWPHRIADVVRDETLYGVRHGNEHLLIAWPNVVEGSVNGALISDDEVAVHLDHVEARGIDGKAREIEQYQRQGVASQRQAVGFHIEILVSAGSAGKHADPPYRQWRASRWSCRQID